MFEKIISDINNREEDKMYNIDLSKNPTFNKGYFKECLDSLDSIQDRDLYELVKGSYRSILQDILDRSDPQYIDAFTKPRFLTVLIQVLDNVQLTFEERVCCNKLAYDYFTLKNNDSYVKQLFFTLSKMVNRDKIPLLMAIGLPENLAVHIALARYSSTREAVNVKRVNFIITTSPKEIMTEQIIVWIYEKLFDNYSIFEGTMFDVYDEDEEWVTDDIMDIYSTVSLAVLEILNNMPSMNIRKVLISYTGDYEALYSGKPNAYRFSMKAISGDYQRIRDVVESLETEGIFVPK